MTERQFQEKTAALGGIIKYPACTITFPKKINIKTKAQALDLLDVIISAWGIRRNGDTEETTFIIEKEIKAFKALKKFLEQYRNGKALPEDAPEDKDGDTLAVMDIPRDSLHGLFREFDEAMEEQREHRPHLRLVTTMG